jgi:hypothetical protein
VLEEMAWMANDFMQVSEFFTESIGTSWEGWLHKVLSLFFCHIWMGTVWVQMLLRSPSIWNLCICGNITGWAFQVLLVTTAAQLKPAGG